MLPGRRSAVAAAAQSVPTRICCSAPLGIRSGAGRPGQVSSPSDSDPRSRDWVTAKLRTNTARSRRQRAGNEQWQPRRSEPRLGFAARHRRALAVAPAGELGCRPTRIRGVEIGSRPSSAPTRPDLGGRRPARQGHGQGPGTSHDQSPAVTEPLNTRRRAGPINGRAPDTRHTEADPLVATNASGQRLCCPPPARCDSIRPG
jgi:hypothetical protein